MMQMYHFCCCLGVTCSSERHIPKMSENRDRSTSASKKDQGKLVGRIPIALRAKRKGIGPDLLSSVVCQKRSFLAQSSRLRSS